MHVRHKKDFPQSSACTKPPHLFPNPGALTWCTNSLQPLYFRRLCTKSFRLFPNPGALTWCMNPLQPLYFRRLCTKSPHLFPNSGALTWCMNPLQPLSFRRLCTKSPRLFLPTALLSCKLDLYIEMHQKLTLKLDSIAQILYIHINFL